MPPEVTITAWAAYSKSPISSRLDARPRSIPSAASRAPRTPVTTPPDLTRSSTRCRNPKVTSPCLGGRTDAALEGSDHTGTGPPGQVEARHRVAVTVRASVTALGPADHREDPQALVVQPLTLLTGRERDVGLGPPARPVVALPVELRAAHPVLQGELVGVLDAHPPLLRAVDEEQSAERPERLPADALLRLLVQQQHPLARVGELGGCDEAREPGADDDDVCIHSVILTCTGCLARSGSVGS